MTGLVHSYEVAHAYVSDLHEYLTEGQTVKVMVIGLENGKINLSIKRTLPAPTREQSPRPRGGFQSRGPQPARQQPRAFDFAARQAKFRLPRAKGRCQKGSPCKRRNCSQPKAEVRAFGHGKSV